MNALRILCIALGLLAPASHLSANTASVKVIVVNTGGDKIEDALVTLAKRGSLTTYRAQLGIVQGLPFGSYDLSVRRRGFLRHTETISVQSESVTFVVGLRIGQILEDPKMTVSYRVQLRGTPENIHRIDWCRLSGLYSKDMLDALRGERSSIAFADVYPGEYILACGQIGSPLVLRLVTVSMSHTSLVVDADSVSK